MIPWSAQALQGGCFVYQPLFAGATHAHMTVECVFGPVVRCQVPRHGEGKGTWRRDTKRGGTWT